MGGLLTGPTAHPQAGAALVRKRAAGTSHGHAPEAAEVDAETLCFIQPTAFRPLWLASFLIYSLVALQLACLAGFYFLLLGFPSVGYYLTMFHLIPLSRFPLAVTAYATMALLIYREIVRMLLLSARHRRLCLLNESALPAAAAKAAQLNTTLRTATHPVAKLRRLWLAYLRLVSVCGPYFEVVTLTREFVEIVVQVCQAYQSSRLTPNAWLNVSYGVLITANCLSSPLIERLFHADLGRERLLVLLVDLALDLVWLLLPLRLFPYYVGGFFGGEAILYEDTFVARASMETQLMLVTSNVDLFVKMLPSLGIYFTLRKLRVLVRRRVSCSAMATTRCMRTIVPLTSVATSPEVSNIPVVCDTDDSPPAGHASLPRHMRNLRVVQRVLTALLLLLGGFTLLMYSLTLSFRGTCESGCKLVLHPWLVYSRCRCAVQEINCHARGIQGAGDDLRRVFDVMERPGLQSLIISHCPQLEVPTEIRWFRDLYGLEIYNCSIVSWPAMASLTATAILLGDLPASLLEIDVIVSNLTTLPDDLHAKWPHVRTLYLDHGRFTTPPRVLGRMRLESLTLYNNSIRVIPNDTFASSSFSYLVFNGNPLTRLPTSLGNVKRLYELQLQQTQVADLSRQWADEQLLSSELIIFAHGSPVCACVDARDDAGAAVVASTARSAASFVASASGLRVSCDLRGSVYKGQRSLSYFALEGKTRDRAIV